MRFADVLQLSEYLKQRALFTLSSFQALIYCPSIFLVILVFSVSFSPESASFGGWIHEKLETLGIKSSPSVPPLLRSIYINKLLINLENSNAFLQPGSENKRQAAAKISGVVVAEAHSYSALLRVFHQQSSSVGLGVNKLRPGARVILVSRLITILWSGKSFMVPSYIISVRWDLSWHCQDWQESVLHAF